MTTNERIAFLMKKLDCTEEEAKDVIRCDRIIDADGNPFPQSKEQAAASKKYRSVGTKKPTVYNLETRKKKQNMHLTLSTRQLIMWWKTMLHLKFMT